MLKLIKKLDDTEFGYWRMHIENSLYEKRLHLSLLGQKLESMNDTE